VLLGKISTGAVNDLERVTQYAYAQVAVYGGWCGYSSPSLFPFYIYFIPPFVGHFFIKPVSFFPRTVGMNEKVGLLSYRMDKDAFDKPYSEETAQMIDNEVRTFVDLAYKRTLALVEEKRSLIEAMSMDLLKKEASGINLLKRNNSVQMGLLYPMDAHCVPSLSHSSIHIRRRTSQSGFQL